MYGRGAMGATHGPIGTDHRREDAISVACALSAGAVVNVGGAA